MSGPEKPKAESPETDRPRAKRRGVERLRAEKPMAERINAEIHKAEMHVFLTGFMGSGKSSVGRLLAEKLGRPFVDLDEEIVARLGAPISEVFAAHGEAYFRRAESELLTEIASTRRPLVAATGGGVVETPGNLAILREHLTFFLDLPPQIAWERIGGMDPARPNARDPESFMSLAERRRPLYLESGERLDASGPPGELAEVMADALLWGGDFAFTCESRECQVLIPASMLSWPATRDCLIGERRAMLLLDHEFRERAAEFAGLLQGAEVVFAIERGEAAKTLEEAGRLLGLMAEARLARDDFLVVAGGGSLCDLGAFCAGLHRRGLNLVLIPTTLLAAVDAAVGGKTAVNHAGAKNQVGHFHLASEVWIDPYILATLPEPLKLEGLTEAYKTGLLLDPDLADLVENHLESLLAGDVTLIAEVARRSASAKAALVERDFRETLGIRDILNLGHTWGHVVESHHGPVVSHGRAVALGLAVALRWSVKNLGYPETLAERGVEACRLLAGGSFPAAPPKSEAERLLTFDKKIRGGKLKYVGLEAPGEPVVVEADPEDVLTTAASF